MMRIKVYLLALILAGTQPAIAQTEGAKLTVPSTPAFSILNFEPTAVMRPTTNKDLAADILNSFDKDGKLLLNLGLEATPYWLQSKPTLTRQEYLNPGVLQSVRQSFSLSAATVKDSSSGDNKLGAGFRFKLFNGKPVDDLAGPDAELKAEKTIISVIAGVRSMVGDEVTTKQQAIDIIVQALLDDQTATDIVTQFRESAAAIEDSYGDSPADIRLFLEKIINDRNDANQELIKKVAELLYQRKGFILEFAGATGFNTSRKNNLEKLGIWGNASYYISPNDLLTVTGRFMYQDNDLTIDTSFNNFDFGVGFLKQTSTYNISAEGMFRWYRAEFPDINIGGARITRVEKDFTYRLAVQGSYIISRDLSLNLSLGKDFNSPFIESSGFFSILGINYSIFNKERVMLEK